MLSIISDAQIADLIREAKTTPNGLSPAVKLNEHGKHKRKEFQVSSASGNEFVVKLRQNTLDVLDYSAILGYRIPQSNVVFRLRRYNGKHTHTNPIEKEKIDGFHVHEATERYQRRGPKEDSYATLTTRHTTLQDAIQCLLEDCGFDAPPREQQQQTLQFGPTGQL